MLVFRAGIHKLLVKIANREDPDQTASDSLGTMEFPIKFDTVKSGWSIT